jgi:hypothetical protein
MLTSAQVRTKLVEALRLDLIGPNSTDLAYQDEILPQAPSKWYLTGFLVPYEADLKDRSDETNTETIDTLSEKASNDDNTEPEIPPPAKATSPFLRYKRLLRCRHTQPKGKFSFDQNPTPARPNHPRRASPHLRSPRHHGRLIRNRDRSPLHPRPQR